MAEVTDNDAESGKSARENGADPLQLLVTERVRSLRKSKGWTLEQLASTSGVSRSMLSQIERGAANPTLGVAHRIAQAFGLTLGQLVDDPVIRSNIDVVRASDPAALFRNDDRCRIRTLSPLNLEKDVEFYEVTIHPGAALESAPHYGGTREFLVVEQGAVRLESGSESAELARGDSAHYCADVPHRITNLATDAALLFLVVIYPQASDKR
jgi:transcriptional regulator with XRE-family HTH domain